MSKEDKQKYSKAFPPKKKAGDSEKKDDSKPKDDSKSKD
jgi:hypothetical protein